ncbi:hypothetical protein FO519_007577 [Halicephalobus sp. NKZ332]|nr:hypothetical protein FO519_007577 [Halicephalobus sp. NKZ332]
MEFECSVCFTSYPISDSVIYCCPFGDEEDSNEVHGTCVDCVRGLAKTAAEDAPVAKGGIGLLCSSCNNIIPTESFQIYLDPDIHQTLMKRLQRESIIEAGLNDMSTCSNCGIEVWVDRDTDFYDCFCGRRQCRNCPRIYDEDHQGISCEELDRQQSPKLESKLSEIAIRTCSRCNVPFVQWNGCNKIVCRCGAKHCYVCRERIEDYSHFCQCGWKGTTGECSKCHKSCPLHGVAEERDKKRMEEIKKKLDGENNDIDVCRKSDLNLSGEPNPNPAVDLFSED